jgi:hypothetical protein
MLTFEAALLRELEHDNMGREFRTICTALKNLPSQGAEARRDELLGQQTAVEAIRSLQLWKLQKTDKSVYVKTSNT